MEGAAATSPFKVALFYDMDACRGPTGVTRHALAQLERLAQRPEIQLSVVSGRVTQPEGHEYWQSLGPLPRKQLPFRSRDALRAWRLVAWPPLEAWTGPADWVYCPAEWFVPARKARRAVTSHDVLQDVRLGSPRRLARLGGTFARSDLILSVSRFNTARLLETFPVCRGRVAHVPNAAEDLFFEPATAEERLQARQELGLPEGLPYLLSVANFQPRKNLERLVRVAARLPELAQGDLALVLLGEGSDEETKRLREVVASAGSSAVIRMPGYRQGRALRAVYAEAFALVFPSFCESFGIPAVEAMAQGVPVALADSTALPEIGGKAGWYFDPESDDAMQATLRQLLDDSGTRALGVAEGHRIAAGFRWQRANDALVAALRASG